MSYQKRRQSTGDIYHVVIRGVGRQLIFEDDTDCMKFRELLQDAAANASVEIFAWCLMGNHAHFVFHAPLDDLSNMMQRVLRSYSSFFNLRHDRVGHLMQGRFRSVPIDDDTQLMSTIVYVHRNPLEAGLSGDCNWRWSSYGEYVGRSDVATTGFVLEVFGGLQAFEEAHRVGVKADALPYRSKKLGRMNDANAMDVLAEVLESHGYSAVPHGDKTKRNAILAELRNRGLSVRQIERLTGIGRNIIANAK